MSIVQLPDVILRFMTYSYCDDASAVALAHTRQLTFRLLKDSYRVRGEVEIVWKEEQQKKEEKSEENGVEAAAEAQDHKHFNKAAATRDSTRFSIEVVYPCVLPLKVLDPLRPGAGQLDPRSYKLPTYFMNTDRLAPVTSHGRSPHRIGILDNICIRTPRIGDGDQTYDWKVTEMIKTCFSLLPATIGLTKIEWCTIECLTSLQHLIRLHTFTFERIHSLDCINEIARLLPQLRVLRLGHECALLLTATDDDVILLPPALEELYLDNMFKQLENRLVINESLRVLHYHGHTMSVHEWKLPSTLTELHLGNHFNDNVDGWTPPSSLRTLILSDQFNHDISKIVWPAGLTRLIGNFRYSLTNFSLPDGLLHLEMEKISRSDKIIGGGSHSESDASFKLPSRLASLVLSTGNGWTERISFAFEPLPLTLKTVILNLRVLFSMQDLNWPHSITELQLDAQHMIDSDDFPLPLRLRILHMKGNISKSLRKFTLPATLESLTMPSDVLCSMELLGSLLHDCSDSLRTLKLGRIPKQSMTEVQLPRTLTHLTLAQQWNRPVRELPELPSSLRFLQFGSDWNQYLSDLQLPSSLRHLHFGKMCNQDVTPLNSILPPMLRELVLPCNASHRKLLRDSLPHLILPKYCRLVVAP